MGVKIEKNSVFFADSYVSSKSMKTCIIQFHDITFSSGFSFRTAKKAEILGNGSENWKKISFFADSYVSSKSMKTCIIQFLDITNGSPFSQKSPELALNWPKMAQIRATGVQNDRKSSLTWSNSVFWSIKGEIFPFQLQTEICTTQPHTPIVQISRYKVVKKNGHFD